MTEARVRVIDNDLVVFHEPISHYPGQGEVELKIFDPSVKISHGAQIDDSIVLTRGSRSHFVEPGDITRFSLENKVIEVTHQGRIYKF